MHETDLFPLETVPSWVRIAILREFEGRRPTVREVNRICDRSWLAVPGIGRTALSTIRQATGNQRAVGVDEPSVPMSDDELLTRLEFLQQEIQSLSEILNVALSPASRRVSRHGRRRRTSSSAHEYQGSGLAF